MKRIVNAMLKPRLMMWWIPFLMGGVWAMQEYLNYVEFLRQAGWS